MQQIILRLSYVLCVALVAAQTMHAQGMTTPNIIGPAGVEVNSYTGNMFYERSDLEIPGPGPSLECSFAYNSQKTALNFGYGNGWTFTYNVLYEVQGSDIVIRREDGRKDLFTWNGTGYDAPTGIYDVLEEYAPGQFRMTNLAGFVYYFDDQSHKRLTSTIDLNGNLHTVAYAAGLPSTITDAVGRSVNLTFVNGLLDQITDNNTNPARTISFAYDAFGNMIEVLDPLGNAIQYSYDAAYNLTQILDARFNAIDLIYDGTARVTRLSSPHSLMTFTYDPSGLFTTATQHDGADTRSTTYNFDPQGRVTQIVGNCCGFDVQYDYDADNNIIMLTDALGNQSHYTYDSFGNMESVTDALGHTASYTYTAGTNWKTSETDKLGHTIHYTYDAKGNLLTVQMPLNITESFTYDSQGNKLSFTNGRGFVTNYTYDAQGNQTGSTGFQRSDIRTYDNVGNVVTSAKIPGAVTTYTYDLLNQLTGETDPMGCTTTRVYDPVGNEALITDGMGNQTWQGYDGLNRLVSVKRPGNATTINVFNGFGDLVRTVDPKGNDLTMIYDQSGRLVQTTDPKGVHSYFTYDLNGNRLTARTGTSNATSYKYDALNRQIEIKDPMGGLTIYDYDANGNRISVSDGLESITLFCYDALDRVSCITDALGNTKTFTYDENDNKLTTTDPLGNTFSMAYNAADRPIQLNGPGEYLVLFGYDQYGRLISKSDPNGLISTYTYDLNGRLASESNALGETTTYTYDCNHNKTGEVQPNGAAISSVFNSNGDPLTTTGGPGGNRTYTYDKNNNILTSTDGNNNVTTYVYDETNRLTSKTDPNGNATLYEYEEAGTLPSRITDRNGNVSEFTFNDNGQITSMTNAEGLMVTYDYDSRGNVTSRTDPNGNATLYEYDALNRKTKESFADGSFVSFTYDANGNMLTRTDSKGDVTNYAYDPLNRLTQRDYPGSNDESFVYDAGGRLLTTSNNDATIVFTYDGANRRTSETLNGRTTSYSYNVALKQRNTTYPGGRVLNYTLNDVGQVLNLKESGTTIADFVYDAAGNLTSRSFPANGTSMSASYNVNNWTTNITHNPGGMAAFEYTFDAEGHIETAEKLHRPSNSLFYAYDDAYRIIEFEEGTLSGGFISPIINQGDFEFDPAGNRVLVGVNGSFTDYTSDALNQYTAIVQGSTINPIHDANGNLTFDGTDSYTYDYENRLISVNAGVTATYKYDPLGRRIEKVTLAGTVKYFYDGLKVIEEVDAGGSVVASYTYGTGNEELLTMNRNANTYFYHEDVRGSIIALTDLSGTIVERYEYDVFGAVQVMDNNYAPLPGSTVDNPYNYTAARFDAETDLMFMRARYYDSNTGRFISRDPIGIWGDDANLGNAYTYVGNEPITSIDPTGEKKWRIWRTIKKIVKSIFKKKNRTKRSRNIKKPKISLEEDCNNGPLSVPTKIKVDFTDCGSDQETVLRAYICPLFIAASQAWLDVEALYKGSGSQEERDVTQSRLQKVLEKKKLKRRHMRKYLRRAKKVLNGLNKGVSFVCRDVRSTGCNTEFATGGAFATPKVGRINFCPSFWWTESSHRVPEIYRQLFIRYSSKGNRYSDKSLSSNYSEFLEKYYLK